MKEANQKQVKLRIFKTLSESLYAIKTNFSLLFRVAIFTFIFHLFFSFIAAETNDFKELELSGINLLLLIVFVVFGLVFSIMSIVNWHQIFIWGKEKNEGKKLINWTGNFWKYIGYGILVSIPLLVGFMFQFAALMLIVIVLEADSVRIVHLLFTILLIAPFFYWMSRWSLVLTACAIHQKTSLSWSWNLSRGNGLRILFLFIFTFIPQIILGMFVDLESPMILQLLFSTFTFFVYLYSISVLSHIYIFLTSQQKQLEEVEKDNIS